ncbi:MAG: hypothetical protein J7K59_04350 [Candidatus Korarchaeota archaeon]|nr:hypothetical protein [Candidatus Korarchaeota archaeon]
MLKMSEGIRERKREKEKEKEITKEHKKTRRKNLAISEIQQDFQISILSDRLLEDELVDELAKELNSGEIRFPEWVKNPWSKIPPHENFLESWIKKWSNIIISFAKQKKKWVFSIHELLLTFPFNDGHRVLDIEYLRKIIDYMAKNNLTEWIDEKKETFIVFWESLDAIAEKLFKKANQLGLVRIRSSTLERILSDLPQPKILEIMNILVRKGYAKWIIPNTAVKLIS